MALVEAFHLTLERPTMLGLVSVLLPVWVAFLAGVAIGWLWKPRLLGRPGKVRCVLKDPDLSLLTLSPTPRSPASPLKNCKSAPCLNSLELQGPSPEPCALGDGADSQPAHCISPDSGVSKPMRKPTLLTEDDLKKLCELVEMKDGGPSWTHMLERSTPNVSYQAWRRDPKTGPPEYRTRTFIEDATPEMVRDFFWDDDFRPKWDDMLAYSSTIEECMTTGNTVVHWIRKFPLFCSDREYVIGRRIWESNRSFYCVTKGVSAPIPRHDKPKRVDLYFSSWLIRAVESKKNNGQLTACEVLLFHYEDMGIPYEIAKLGVRQGMWGAVKKIEPGLRAYQKARLVGEPISRLAYMARINTKVDPHILHDVEAAPTSTENSNTGIATKPAGSNFPKVLLMGGAIVLACSLSRGVLSQAVVVGAMGKIADMRKKIRGISADDDPSA